jgi:hypothetical protein
MMAQREDWEYVRCELIMGAYPRVTGRGLRGGRMQLLRITTSRLPPDPIYTLTDKTFDAVASHAMLSTHRRHRYANLTIV